ncbi:MAG TPA: response regulator transcription factor [Bryobacteraceae bacterium]|jgi:DNA-binding NarL/FixJ family response regulator|nr:response regulator transcription factor [Bryobacteraceae bacterium]
MVRVLIADDHPIVRKGLRQVLSEQPDMEIVEAENGSEALRRIDESKFNVVLLDLSMPGLSGLEVLSQIKARQPEIPVLVLSGYPETEFAVRILRAGASGYLNKEMAPEELMQAIRVVMSGRKYIGPAVAELLANTLDGDRGELHASLSDREFQVLLLIGAGKTVSEIAEQIALSVKTVSTYRARILEKMNLKNNAELMRYVIENKVGTDKAAR